MRSLVLLFIHLSVLAARSLKSGGIKSIIAENLILKKNANINDYGWQQHCRGLFQTPIPV
ncbi:MAG: hypothetical protein ACI9ON_003059 [Limisphaerales bacterium]|jgi:hypothetical protein